MFLRALQVATEIYLITLLLQNILKPDSVWWTFRLTEVRVQLLDSGPRFGALFAAAYAAFYTRFASQWSYLADVYNQIKAAESQRDVNEDRIAEWKAGFIEDANDLHLLRKRMFASIAHAWLGLETVRDCFRRNTPDGAKLLPLLTDQVAAALKSSR